MKAQTARRHASRRARRFTLRGPVPKSLSRAVEIANKGGRVLLGQSGRDLAAVVSLADYELLALIQDPSKDAWPLVAALRAEVEAARTGEKPIPWRQARLRL